MDEVIGGQPREMLELDSEPEEQMQKVELARKDGSDIEDDTEERVGVVAAGGIAVRERDWRMRVG